LAFITSPSADWAWATPDEVAMATANAETPCTNKRLERLMKKLLIK
jgi:hypothetical protein